VQEFKETILPLTNRLYRYAYRLTMNERDAEDLVQDALLRAFDKFSQYKSGTSPLAWMMTILRSIFINKYRKKKREGHQVAFEDLNPSGEVAATEAWGEIPENPEEYLFRNVLDHQLRDALRALSEPYLEVILLVDLEELSYREVSDILNIPPGTVMSRLHRARKQLQSQVYSLAVKRGVVKEADNVKAFPGQQKRGAVR
jgi:RNA polymerase sigma-70 factor (ECF subfamily)